MNPVQRFFRRYIFSTIGILVLFFVVNIALVLSILIAGYMSGTDNGLSVREVSSHVTEQDGVWTADDTALTLLREHDAWAMLLGESGTVIWDQGLPAELPRSLHQCPGSVLQPLVPPGLPGESVESGGRYPDGGGNGPGHSGEILLFHGYSLPDDVPGGDHRGLCVQPASDGLPDAAEHPPGREGYVPHPTGYSSPEQGQLSALR